MQNVSVDAWPKALKIVWVGLLRYKDHEMHRFWADILNYVVAWSAEETEGDFCHEKNKRSQSDSLLVQQYATVA